MRPTHTGLRGETMVLGERRVAHQLADQVGSLFDSRGERLRDTPVHQATT